MPDGKFLLYLLVMAGVTYLVRMIPMVLIKEKIKTYMFMVIMKKGLLLHHLICVFKMKLIDLI